MLPIPAFSPSLPLSCCPSSLRRPRAAESLAPRSAPLPRVSSPQPSRRVSPSARADTPTPHPLFGGAAPGKTIIIFGGASALGVEIARNFEAAKWRVVSLDFYDSSVAACGVNGCALPNSPSAPVQIALPAGAAPRMQLSVAASCLRKAKVESADLVVNATLGYATGGISDEDVFDTLEYMYHTGVESSLTSARLASLFLAPGGMLALLGSKAALSAQPQMLNFSLCKAAVHQMVKSLALTVGNELPKGASVLALVPEVLDTPLHRSMNQGQAAGHWTPCDAVANKLLEWAKEPEKRPPNASLVSISSSIPGAVEAGAKQHQFRLIDNPSFVQSTPL